jgi:hypothetical protein
MISPIQSGMNSQQQARRIRRSSPVAVLFLHLQKTDLVIISIGMAASTESIRQVITAMQSGFSPFHPLFGRNFPRETFNTRELAIVV